MKELLEKNIVKEDEDENKGTISVSNGTMNISRIDRKRVSLYDFGYNTAHISRADKIASDLHRRQEQETANIQRK